LYINYFLDFLNMSFYISHNCLIHETFLIEI